jgi:hypothetical protein
MRTAEHDVVDRGVAAVGIQLLVHAAPFGLVVHEGLDRRLRAGRHLEGLGLWRHADDVIHLDAAGRGRRGAEVLQPDDLGPVVRANDDGNPFLHHVADEVSQHAPVHHGVDGHPYFDAMGAEPVFVPVQTPVRNASGEHRRARALASLGVRACADHRVAVDHRGGFHPGAMLPSGRDVARQIRRARLEDLDALAHRERLARLVAFVHLGLHAQRLPVQGIAPALQVARVHGGLRGVQEFVGVEIEIREDGVAAALALVLVVVLEERVGRSGHAGHVARLDEPLGPERLGVSHQQVHRLLRGSAVAAVEHRLFSGCEYHRWIQADLKVRLYAQAP